MGSTRFTVVPALSRGEAMALARVEADRILALLDGLTPQQWQVATECPPWTVRDLTTHLLGNHEGLASVGEQLRQLWGARRRGGDLVDAISATQLADRAALTGPEIVGRLRAAFSGSIRARQRWPGVVRTVPLSIPLLGQQERWSLAYLHDVIYPRDAWMHRMDICRAVGVPPVLDAAHDGVMIGRIVQEWADRHDQPYQLELTGAAGGSFSRGTDGEAFSLDAIDFARFVSGRGNPTGLLAVPVGY